jgi:hypothetical protein
MTITKPVVFIRSLCTVLQSVVEYNVNKRTKTPKLQHENCKINKKGIRYSRAFTPRLLEIARIRPLDEVECLLQCLYHVVGAFSPIHRMSMTKGQFASRTVIWPFLGAGPRTSGQNQKVRTRKVCVLFVSKVLILIDYFLSRDLQLWITIVS